MPAVSEYIQEGGSSPFGEWFAVLDEQAAAKVAMAKYRLELGHRSNVKRIGAIAEYRIDWGPGYRIYFGKDGDELKLLGGGTKKHQNADIERAEAMWDEYRTRKRKIKVGRK